MPCPRLAQLEKHLSLLVENQQTSTRQLASNVRTEALAVVIDQTQSLSVRRSPCERCRETSEACAQAVRPRRVSSAASRLFDCVALNTALPCTRSITPLSIPHLGHPKRGNPTEILSLHESPTARIDKRLFLRLGSSGGVEHARSRRDISYIACANVVCRYRRRLVVRFIDQTVYSRYGLTPASRRFATGIRMRRQWQL